MGISSAAAHTCLERLETIGAGFPEVSTRLSHGTPTLFIREKKTLCSLWEDHHGDGELAIWVPAAPGVQHELVESDPERFYLPPYVAHRGWVGMRLNIDPDWNEVAAILDDAYRLVAPKTLIKQLDADA